MLKKFEKKSTKIIFYLKLYIIVAGGMRQSHT